MTEKGKEKIPGAVITLGIVSLLTDVATEMIYPLVPLYVAALGSGAMMLGIIEGIAETTAALLKLISGVISDKIGKRKMLVLLGYSISSLARPATGVVSSAIEIVFIRMLDRVGKGIRTAPRDAIIASSVDECGRGRAFGFHRSMDHTGAVLGPIMSISTLLLLFLVFGISDPLEAMRWTFILAVIPGIITIIIIITSVKESPIEKIKTGLPVFSLKNFDKNFRAFLFTMIFFTLGNSSDAFLLFRIGEAVQRSGAAADLINGIGPMKELFSKFGNESDQARVVGILFIPLVWAFFHVIKAVFSTPLGSLSDRIGRKIMIQIGLGIYALVYFSFALLVYFPPDAQVPATFILFGIYALFYAFTEGTEKAFVADLVREEFRGSAYGLYYFGIGITALPASLIFGFLYSFFDRAYPGFGGTIAFGTGGAIAVVSMILLALTVNEPKRG